MRVHQFKCINHHEFFLPLHLPEELTEIAEILGELECPLCHCSSEEIKLTPRKYNLTLDIHVGGMGEI